MNDWIFNEFVHCGVDYSDTAMADGYDDEHQKFRNYKQEVLDLLKNLSLDAPEKMTLIDLGCGTGAIAIHAAGHFKKVYAVDVSEKMLACAREKAAEKRIGNVEFVNSGFLNYTPAESADIVLTKVALHHLPDFWKQIALLNINKMLKPGGILYIFDVVFHFSPAEYETRINNWIGASEKIFGEKLKQEIKIHIRDEYSTFNWIMEEMLKRAGFVVEKVNTPDGMITEYFCKKTKEIHLSA